MERRTFLAAGAWLSATAGTGAPWRARALPGGIQRADFALIDTTLAEATALSDHAMRVRVPILDVNRAPHADIAALWYDLLAPRAAASGGHLTLVGVTRAADFFVLTRLALPPAAPVTQVSGTPRRACVAFALAL
ncbi:hypothetical protein H3V53_40085 [Paraburkholderia bengalensis]|uniref:Uncharacterized protein n=1 Tax=Paraburkholderia bengalensis TaxID=2747562 RepID=A0ABU8J5Q3_9BURK